MTVLMSERGGPAGAAGSQPTQEMAAELQRLVERGRSRWRLLILVEAISLAVAAPLAYLWLVFLLDNFLYLPAWGLLLANVLFFVGVIWLGRRLLRSWRRARFTTDQVALAMEQRTPGGVQNRLINVLQLSRGGGAVSTPSMTEAVVGENYQFLKQVRLQQSAESWPVIMRAAVALLLVAVGVGFWTVSSERFTTSAGRLFMPLAGIEPVYRTRLQVTPGNVTISAGQDVTVRVQIEGRVPEHVQLMVDEGDRQSSHQLAVDRETATASYTFPAVQSSMAYALRGGDFRTPQFQITVPAELELRHVHATLKYPAYTGLAEQNTESSTGDLEALVGSDAELTFTFNQPVEAAWLVVVPDEDGGLSGNASSASDLPDHATRVEMSEVSPERFSAQYTFDRSGDYLLEARRAGGEDVRTPAGRLVATTDQAPEVELSGVKADSEAMLEDVLDLSVRAGDDYGLAEVGLFWRPVSDDAGADDASAERAPWQAIRTWDVSEDQQTERFRADVPLLLSTLEVAEGDRLELATRGRDNDPAKGDDWATGITYLVTASSPGALLQMTYERILRTESQIDDLIDRHAALERDVSRWIANLEPDSGMRWDDQANLDALAEAMQELAKTQSDIRAAAGATARQMPSEAGRTLPQALGMLADTEMVRHIRILERVTAQDTPQAKRSTLADARLTLERTVRSLNEMQERYVAIREDWELNHMISFTEMLAQRQERLSEASLAYLSLDADAMSESQRASISRRQAVVLELSELAEVAFDGMVMREDEVGEILADSFADAADAYAGSGLKDEMKEAGELLDQGDWSQAEPLQSSAAEKLAGIYRDLRRAQSEVAREALSRLEELAETDPLAEQMLQELRAGFDESVIALEDHLSLADTVRALELEQQLREEQERQAALGDGEQDRISYEDHMSSLQRAHRDKLDTSEHTLSDTFMEDRRAMIDETPQRNPGETVIQEELEDVIGDLIAEAEELQEDYVSYQATASWTVMDTGSDVSRSTEEPLSSTGATSTTGNQPPPSDDVGGAARTGRLGGRSHGLAVGDEFTDRHGREAQEGQENIAEQGGPAMEEVTSEDPQADESTGTGGRRVDSDETHFSTQDAGEWTDDIADEMEDPQETHQIVERQGQPLDPEIAAKMRDTENRQEQMIERIKAVKKDLDELFLPTDHLDDILSRMENNLDRLREAPDAAVFREQVELLDQLQASVIVFQRPSSEFVQSVPRQQQLRGLILDEKAAMPFPGYEDAVDRYYRGLLELEDPQ